MTNENKAAQPIVDAAGRVAVERVIVALNHLADDMEAVARIGRPTPDAIYALTALRNSRLEAVYQLDRLVGALPDGLPDKATARFQRDDLQVDRRAHRPQMVRNYAMSWQGALGAWSAATVQLWPVFSDKLKAPYLAASCRRARDEGQVVHAYHGLRGDDLVLEVMVNETTRRIGVWETGPRGNALTREYDMSLPAMLSHLLGETIEMAPGTEAPRDDDGDDLTS